MRTYAVRLSQEELRDIAQNGLERALNAIWTGASLQQPHYARRSKYYYEDNITAAIAEWGVCTAYGFEYQWAIGNAGLNRPDAGPLEVRTIQRFDAGLVAKPKDVPHQKIVLTQVIKRTVYLLGWATAEQVRTYGTPRGAVHILDQADLLDMDELGLERTSRALRLEP